MNAIQYGAQAGALNQIAQGRSLQRVHGTGEAFNQSYDAMAETQADMQNIQAKETARSAREHFKGIGTSSAEGSAYSRVSRLQADQRFEEMQGSTDAYETARGVNPNIAREQAQLGAASKFKSTEASLNNINAGNHQDAIDRLSSAEASRAGDNAFKSSAGFQKKVEIGSHNADGSINNNSYVKDSNGKDQLYSNALKSQAEFEAGQEVGGTLPFGDKKAMGKMLAELNKNAKDKINQLESSKATSWFGGLSSREQFHNAEIDKEIKGIQNSMPKNANDLGQLGLNTGFAQISAMTAGNVGSLNMGNGGMQGGFQSGVSYSHNASRNYSYGITASGGSTFAGLAHSAGIGMESFAAASSALSAVGQIASTASMFGRIAGGVSSLMGGAGGDALMAAQQGVQRASARVASAQSQLNWATEQAAGTHQRFGGAYAGMNAQQIGKASADLQMGIHDMNMRVGRLNGIKNRLLDEGVSKYDPTIKSLNRQMRHLNTNINRDGMRVKYLGLRNNQINAEHNLAQAQLEESFARIKLSSL